MPNKMCYAQRSTKGKKRVKSHGPVLLVKVFEVGGHNQQSSVHQKQFYPSSKFYLLIF